MAHPILTAARQQYPAMMEQLKGLVDAESPSNDPDALFVCAGLISTLWEEVTETAPEHITRDDRIHLLWNPGGNARVLLLGHYDTVWPTGTINDWPFTLTDGIARGPGVLDMKAGIIQILTALHLLGEEAGHVAVLLTADEEIGSSSSRDLIEDTARSVDAVLVCEPATPDGAVKIARRGTAHYRVTAHGRAAHAGEEPERGINATLELAAQIPAIAALASSSNDTTVTPTTAQAGSTTNTVPETGHVDVDARAWTQAELERVDKQIRALQPTLDGAHLNFTGSVARPPFEPELTAPLVAALEAAANELGLPVPEQVKWRSASDANLTAGVGTPTLDGLGGVGAHPHGRDEHVIADTIPDRGALLAVLIQRLVTAPIPAS